MCLVSYVAGSATTSGVGLCIGFLSNFFMENNLLSNLLTTFSFALKNNTKLFNNDFFQMFLYPYKNYLTQ